MKCRVGQQGDVSESGSSSKMTSLCASSPRSLRTYFEFLKHSSQFRHEYNNGLTIDWSSQIRSNPDLICHLRYALDQDLEGSNRLSLSFCVKGRCSLFAAHEIPNLSAANVSPVSTNLGTWPHDDTGHMQYTRPGKAFARGSKLIGILITCHWSHVELKIAFQPRVSTKLWRRQRFLRSAAPPHARPPSRASRIQENTSGTSIPTAWY